LNSQIFSIFFLLKKEFFSLIIAPKQKLKEVYHFDFLTSMKNQFATVFWIRQFSPFLFSKSLRIWIYAYNLTVIERINRLASWLAARYPLRSCRASAISKNKTFVPPVEERSSHAICGTQEARHHSSLADPSCVLHWRDDTDKGANARAAQHPRSWAQQDTLSAEAI